jgi:cyclophilin family peptidyl-prolyl cis-trans isomerase
MVRFQTTLGDFTLQLDAEKAPISVANFLSYVDDGFFDGLIFHRVIPGFMIQGGGFTPDMAQKKNDKGTIKNEAPNGLKNKRGTIAMARTNVVDSATSQFFINLSDNAFLDHQGPANYGYAVFGHVVEGIETIDAIANERTGRSKGHEDVPVTAVVINTARRVDSAS